MKQILVISTLFLLIACVDKSKNVSSTTSDTASCDKSAVAFLKLANNSFQADFFHQLDSIKKVQYPQNDQDAAIFVDLTPKLLNMFLKDMKEGEFSKTNKFEKEYNFNIAPPDYTDSKECKDKISITFDKRTCSFLLVIYNEFFAEWCQESTIFYEFKIAGDKIYDLRRNIAG